VLCAAALASGPILWAQADNLNDKKHRAQQSVKSAKADLEDASAAAYGAMAKLAAARTELAGAQQRLARVEGQLTAARVVDAQMQAKLAAATLALESAQAQLAAGVRRAKDQRAAIGRLVAADYQFGDPRLLGLSMVLNSQDPTQLASQLNTVDSLMDRETATYQRFVADRALLRVAERTVADAQAQVAVQRQAAAANLAKQQVLEKAAAANKAQVAQLVAQQTLFAKRAIDARRADQAKLRAAQRAEERITAEILARARRNHHGGFRGRDNGFLLEPVADSYITSPYGWRIHPIYHYWGLHNGDDFAAPCGKPELAAASGTIIAEYYDAVWGNRLFLDVGRVNGKEMVLIYNHISRYRIRSGFVQRGETIAYAGTTGWSTGCHLHFTVMMNGVAVNPVRFF
jgi:murein DD-endopeptidase MepM/ murein hydrolase activator NlpD